MEETLQSAIHVRMEGFTAFFKHPLTITGTQITLPCPPYSTILGLISACAGRVVSHRETRIGYEFWCKSTGTEIERTDRMAMDRKGNLRYHREGQGILTRYVHFSPILELYFTNPDLESNFKNPANAPCLGRSQDLFWIAKVERVDLNHLEEGNLGPTLLSIDSVKSAIPSLIVRCPEWLSNDVKGFTRILGPVGFYQAILPTVESKINVKMHNLYHPSNLNNPDDVIYLHQWSTGD